MYNQSSIINYLNNKNFDFIKGDVRDESLVSSLIKNCDIIIPLAGLVGAPICDKYPILAEDVNLKSNIKLINKISNDQIIIMPTTNSAYGKGDKNNYCDEESKLNPISTYAKHKVEVENILLRKKFLLV